MRTELITQPVVEVFVDSNYVPLPLNGEPYVQLFRKDSSPNGCQWAATVKLNTKTGKYKYAATGYPVLMRAVVTGGSIRETLASPFVSFE